MGDRREWTTGEEAALKVIAPLGVKHCAYVFGRSVTCVRMKASRMGVSLTPGREVDVSGLLPDIVERVRVSVGAELCPACGKRQIGVVRTGLCGVCHKSRLIETQRDRLAEDEARREQQVVWQDASRARKKAGER